MGWLPFLAPRGSPGRVRGYLCQSRSTTASMQQITDAGPVGGLPRRRSRGTSLASAGNRRGVDAGPPASGLCSHRRSVLCDRGGSHRLTSSSPATRRSPIPGCSPVTRQSAVACCWYSGRPACRRGSGCGQGGGCRAGGGPGRGWVAARWWPAVVRPPTGPARHRGCRRRCAGRCGSSPRPR